MITQVIANLVTYPLDGIIHQANCFNTMNSGVAKSIREKYPEAYDVDCITKRGDKNKLGTFSSAKTKDGKIIFNLYSQYDFGYDGKCYTNYEAIERGLGSIKRFAKSCMGGNVKLGLPCRMGCTRGGGDWNMVLDIIKKEFENDTLNLYICEFKDYSTEANDFKNKLRAAYKKADLMGEEL